MKRFLCLPFVLLSLSILLSATAGCAPPSTPPPATAIPTQAESAGPWEIILQREIEQPMRIAAFLDGDFGVTGGPSDPGRVHYTIDGGQTWAMAESSAA